MVVDSGGRGVSVEKLSGRLGIRLFVSGAIGLAAARTPDAEPVLALDSAVIHCFNSTIVL